MWFCYMTKSCRGTEYVPYKLLTRKAEYYGKIRIRSNRLNGQTYFSVRVTFSCLIHKAAEFLVKNPAQHFRNGEMGMGIPGSCQGLRNFNFKDRNTPFCSR